MTTLKIRLGATITDLEDTLSRGPYAEPSNLSETLTNLLRAYKETGKSFPHFTDDFDILYYAGRSPQLDAYLVAVFDALIPYAASARQFVFGHTWNMNCRAFDFHVYIEAQMVREEVVAVRSPLGTEFRRTKYTSTRAAPQSIVSLPPPPPPPAEPKKRRMVLRRGA